MGAALALANIPYIAIDYNFQTVQKYKKRIGIIWGSNDLDVPKYAQLENAAVVIAVPLRHDQAITMNVKSLYDRSSYQSYTEGTAENEGSGRSIVLPEFEASMMIRRIFVHKR